MADNNDDFTDLTEDAEAGGKGEKKKKKEKKPKQAPTPAETPAPTADKKAKGGKKKGGMLKLLLIIVPVVLIGAFAAAVVLNFFGTRDMVNGWVSEPLKDFLIWLDPELSEIEETIRQSGDERSAGLDVREGELDAREEEIGVREAEAESREEQQDRRSSALDRREAAMNEAAEAAPRPDDPRRELTEQELADIQSVSRTYAQMPPETAAEILTELYEIHDVAMILFHMTERNVAAILGALEVGFAARVTELLLGN
jgi:flagellar motility protein MotE (MotC chaperone)